MNVEFRTLNRIFHRCVPLLGTSSVVAVGDTRHCLFQAVAHRSSISPYGGKCGLTNSLAAVLAACWLIAASPVAAQAPPAAKPAPTWQSPRAANVKAQVLAWLDATKAAPDVRAKAAAIWSGLSPRASEDDLLIRLARTSALVDPHAAKLVALCSEPRGQLLIPAQPWLRDGSVPPLLANNLRLLFARWLVEQSMFDEALEQLSGLAPGDVVAPAALLFYQSVVYHALLNKESGLKSIDVLLQGAEATPRRYVALAQLMQDDLKGLEEDTLDHIARRMEDIRRRLDLGRAGPKVRKVEKGVIESLDKLIKKLEDEQQQESSSANSTRSTQPRRRKPDHRRARAGGSDEEEHRLEKRLGRHACQAARRGHAADRTRFSRPLSRRHRTILPASRRRKGRVNGQPHERHLSCNPVDFRNALLRGGDARRPDHRRPHRRADTAAIDSRRRNRKGVDSNGEFVDGLAEREARGRGRCCGRRAIGRRIAH